MFDLGHGTTEMSRLVTGVQDDQLELATPCTEWTVADLLAHVHQFTSVFTTNAAKSPPDPPTSLVDDWRTAIPQALDALAVAWRDESAWHGTVSAGGVEMGAADNAIVAAEELSMHGWDLAHATGQELTIDAARLDEIDQFFTFLGGAPFGPPVEPPADASREEQTVARTGRNPRWVAPR